MPFDFETVSHLAGAFNDRLSGKHLAHFCLFSPEAGYFHLSGGGRLFFNLDNQNPYVYLSANDFEYTSFNTTFSTCIRKEMGNALIEGVRLINEDRIIAFDLITINDVFKQEKRQLIAELIPSKANLILLDADHRVLGSLRSSSLSDPRPLFRGVAYLPPDKAEYTKKPLNAPFDFEQYNLLCQSKEDELSVHRKKERFHRLFTFVQTKKKASKRKVAAIKNDIQEAKEHLDDGKYGDFIYMNYDKIDPTAGAMEYEGQAIPLDKARNKNQNAEMFYKRSKKSRLTYKLGQSHLAKAEKEESQFEHLSLILSSSDEDGLALLSHEFGLDQNDEAKAKKKKTSSLLARESLPYSVTSGGTTYLFGKSAAQNDFLSFLYDTSKKHTWMHLIGHTGAHLIIKKDGAAKDEIQLAAELLLLCSDLQEGEAMYALRKDVKRGRVPGEAIVKKYQTLRVSSPSAKARQLYAEAHKIDF